MVYMHISVFAGRIRQRRNERNKRKLQGLRI